MYFRFILKIPLSKSHMLDYRLKKKARGQCTGIFGIKYKKIEIVAIPYATNIYFKEYDKMKTCSGHWIWKTEKHTDKRMMRSKRETFCQAWGPKSNHMMEKDNSLFQVVLWLAITHCGKYMCTHINRHSHTQGIVTHTIWHTNVTHISHICIYDTDIKDTYIAHLYIYDTHIWHIHYTHRYITYIIFSWTYSNNCRNFCWCL